MKKWGQKRGRNWDPFLELAGKNLILAHIPKAPETVPFLGPHFGGGNHFPARFLEPKIWMQSKKKYRRMPPVLQQNAAL